MGCNATWWLQQTGGCNATMVVMPYRLTSWQQSHGGTPFFSWKTLQPWSCWPWWPWLGFSWPSLGQWLQLAFMDGDPILWWIPLAITMGTHGLPHMAHLGWPQIHTHDGQLVVWQATARVFGSWAMFLLFMAFWFLVAGLVVFMAFIPFMAFMAFSFMVFMLIQFSPTKCR